MNKRKRLVLERFPEAYAYKNSPHSWRINILLENDVPHTLASGRTLAQAWLLAESCPTLPQSSESKER